MKLYIFEKRKMAVQVANEIGNPSKHDGFFQIGDKYITWVSGHFFELVEPHEYNPEWEDWDLANLPMFPDNFKTRLIKDKGAKKQFGVIKSLAEKASQIINGGDAGQEGELIIRWVLDHIQTTAEMKRLWMSSLTSSAIQKALNNIRPAEEFDLLYQAGKARSQADWLIGMNATRAFTKQYSSGKNVLSIGRVQTPTLNMVVQRDLEIENFVPSDYWVLTTEFKGSKFTHHKKKFTEQAQAQRVLNKVSNQPFKILSVKQSDKSNTAPLPFDLTSAQAAANKLFGYDLDQTLSLIQSLYEKKHLSYPRVDNRYLPEDMFSEAPAVLQALEGHINGFEINKITVKKTKLYNDSKITDHHAIVPTGEVPDPASLSAEEFKIYDLISRQFIAQFYPKAILSVTEVEGGAAQEKFTLKGTVVKQRGWQDIALVGKKAKQSEIPEFTEGEQGPHTPNIETKQTTPPKRFTPDTLILAMDNAGRFIEEKELAEQIKEIGIGRPATRAAIIKGLIRKKFIQKKGKNLISTETGRKMIQVIRNDVITKPELTAKWEKALRGIEKGEYSYDKFMASAKKLTLLIVQEVINGEKVSIVADDSITDLPCPQCQKSIRQTPKTFQCSACDYVIYRKVGKSPVSLAAFKEILTSGQTSKPRTFKNKDGKSFKAHLKIKEAETDQKMKFFEIVFPKQEAFGLDCPDCNNPLNLTEKAVFCSNKACDFVLFRTFGKNKITIENLKEIISKGKTLCTGFKSKKGRYNVLLSRKKEGVGYDAEFKS